jgi:hypothetical protein
VRKRDLKDASKKEFRFVETMIAPRPVTGSNESSQASILSAPKPSLLAKDPEDS